MQEELVWDDEVGRLLKKGDENCDKSLGKKVIQLLCRPSLQHPETRRESLTAYIQKARAVVVARVTAAKAKATELYGQTKETIVSYITDAKTKAGEVV